MKYDIYAAIDNAKIAIELMGKNSEFSGYDCYENNIKLKAKNAEDAIAEAIALQEKHDAKHIEKYGDKENMLYAPNYVVCIHAFDEEENEMRKIVYLGALSSGKHNFYF